MVISESYFVMELIRGHLFEPGRRSGAEVGLVSLRLVAERLAGERIDRQWEVDVLELDWNLAPVLRGVHADRFFDLALESIRSSSRPSDLGLPLEPSLLPGIEDDFLLEDFEGDASAE